MCVTLSKFMAILFSLSKIGALYQDVKFPPCNPDFMSKIEGKSNTEHFRT